jgi:hypothetical protein
MRTINGWREAGRALRWARTQDGFCHHVKRSWPEDDYTIGGTDPQVIEHLLTIGTNSVEMTVSANGNVRVEGFSGDCEVTISGCDGAGEVLSILAALRLVPVEFGQVTS